MKVFKFIVTFIVLLLSTSAFAAFPGENGKIAFQKANGEIWLTNPDGSEQTVLKSRAVGFTAFYHAPKWSADGTKILFSESCYDSWCGGGLWATSNRLWSIGADGSSQFEIAELDPEGSPAWPGAFSPNGGQIVYIVFEELSTADAVEYGGTGSDRVRLVTWETVMTSTGASLREIGGSVELPTWSPDGAKIVFDVIRSWSDGTNNGTYTDLFMINPDGTNLVQITHNTPVPNMRVYERSFDWSPDGAKLVFTRSVHSLDFSTNTFSIFTCDADGSNRVELLGPMSEGLGNPVWSPDGTKILFDRGNPHLIGRSSHFSELPTTAALYIMNTDGTNVTQITDNTEARYWPNWQPIPRALVSTGTNVSVTAPSTPSSTEPAGATLIFSSVTQDGYVNVQAGNQGPTPPSGYRKGLYYTINNTALFGGSVVACFPWKQDQFYFEDDVEVFQFENGAWTNVTTSVNTGSNQACGQSGSLSLFGLFEPKVSFENGKIAFEKYDRASGTFTGISIMNADGSGEMQVTNGPDHFPHWSGNGPTLLFTQIDSPYGGRLYTVGSDGSNLTSIPNNPCFSSPWCLEADLSPDGTKIAFTVALPYQQRLFKIMNVDGTRVYQVQLPTCTYGEFISAAPAWSQDGTKIAFDGGCPGVDNVYTVNADGTDLIQVTNNVFTPNSHIFDYYPEWSPDGTKLIFSHSVHSLDYSTNQFSIVTANADGSNAVAVLGPTTEGFMNPMWSPDGTKIVFNGAELWIGATSSSTGKIFTMNPDGTNFTQITDNTDYYRFQPDWQPIPVQSPAFTDIGNDIPVQPVDSTTGETPATITFDSVTEAGETTLSSAISGPTPPSGFKVGDPAIYYDISSTATFSGTVALCFAWTEGQFDNENNVALFHYENGSWQNVTTSLDTNANKVCGQTSSLSPFALFETAYTFAGFFSPVDNPPTRNVAKAGSAIPVKFSLGGNYGLSVFSSGYPASQSVQCDTSAPISAIEETVTAGGSSLTYIASSNQYSYVWKTNKAWVNSCRRLVLVFNDGTTKTADFSFTK